MFVQSTTKEKYLRCNRSNRVCVYWRACPGCWCTCRGIDRRALRALRPRSWRWQRTSASRKRPTGVRSTCHINRRSRCPRTPPRSVSRGSKRWRPSRTRRPAAAGNLASRSGCVSLPGRRTGNTRTAPPRRWPWRWCWYYRAGPQPVALSREYSYSGPLSPPSPRTNLTSLSSRFPPQREEKLPTRPAATPPLAIWRWQLAARDIDHSRSITIEIEKERDREKHTSRKT